MRLVDKHTARDREAKVPTDLDAPASGNKVYYDSETRGFGVRVTAAGARAFILNYRTRAGRERRFTIGGYPDLTVAAARKRATELKDQIRVNNFDPLAEIRADRDAPTVQDLCERFEDEHLPKTRPSTARDYKALIKNDILPALKHLKVSDVTFADVDGLHRKMTKRGSPIQANRAVAVLSKMFSLAVKWGWRTDNPAKGIERNQEEKRQRYLSAEEIKALSTALAKHEDQQAANIIRLLLLTGARRAEVSGMRWDQLDLKQGVWTKPGATTKQKTEHRVPLSAPARQLLVELRSQAEAAAKRKNAAPISDYIFPGRSDGHRVELKAQWAEVCKAAKIGGARMHDLRHTFASVLVSSGHSLELIGRMLGHTQAQTTARYSHLQDDPLRRAAEQVGALVTGMPSAEVVPITQGSRRSS